MSQFKITKELLSSYCQSGLTTKEMASSISAASGYPCSVGTVRKACEAYGIDLRRKPLKSPFTFGDSATSTAQEQPRVDNEVNAEGEVRDIPAVRF
jgi:hypothetical protein